MAPLADKYKIKTDLHIVICQCGNKFASKMMNPKCSKCLGYVEK